MPCREPGYGAWLQRPTGREGVIAGLEHSLVNLVEALVLGAVIGAERQWRQRFAGIRTNALVALGAAGFVTFSQLMPGDASPTRVAAQVVSGIGFLGAGVIFREGADVKGLNTAATIWCSAAAGLLAGIGAMVHAVLFTALVVAIHMLLRPLIKAVRARFPGDRAEAEGAAGGQFHLRLVCAAESLPGLRQALATGLDALPGVTLLRLDGTELASGDGQIEAEFASRAPVAAALERLLAALSGPYRVTAARWRADASGE